MSPRRVPPPPPNVTQLPVEFAGDGTHKRDASLFMGFFFVLPFFSFIIIRFMTHKKITRCVLVRWHVGLQCVPANSLTAAPFVLLRVDSQPFSTRPTPLPNQSASTCCTPLRRARLPISPRSKRKSPRRRASPRQDRNQVASEHVRFPSPLILHRGEKCCNTHTQLLPPQKKPPPTPTSAPQRFDSLRLKTHQGCSVPRMREFLLRVPTEENGPCPLIYRLSQEEDLLMHLKLTSCVHRPIFLGGASSIPSHSPLLRRNAAL